MSTLDGPIWSRGSIALIAPPGHITSTHRAGKDGARAGMNVTSHQEKKKNEEMKTGKKRAGKKRKRKQVTDFKEAVCCPSVVGQGATFHKMKGGGQGNWSPQDVQHPFWPNPNGVVGDCTTTLRQLLIGGERHRLC